MRYLIALLVTLISSSVFAEGSVGPPAVQYTPMIWSFGNTIGPSIPEVCNKLKTQMESGGNPPEWEEPPTPVNQPAGSGIMYCRYKTKDAAYQYPQIGGSCPTGYQMDLAHPTPLSYRCKTGVQCPTGSTNVGGQCICNAGLKPNGGKCEAPVCTAGKDPGPIYLGMGTSAGPGKPWQVDPQKVSQSVAGACAGGCALKLTPQSQQNGSCYAAAGDPVGGTVSCAVTGMEETGSPCATGGTDNSSPPASSKPDTAKPATTCAAGQQAYVINGVTKCYTPSGDSVPSTSDNKSMVTTNQITKNADGSTTVVTTTVNQATGQSSTTTVTYPAGSTVPDGLPTTSTSPVIPGMGTGGTSGAGGGGAGVPSGGGGSGSGGDGTGDAHCGAAGQPPCKIDETGTPTDGDLSEQHTAFDQAAEGRENAISAIGDSQRVTELPWVWSPSFPTGSCQNLDFNIQGGKGATIDMCSSGHLQSARQLWAWLLYMLFAVYAWKRFTGSVERD